MFRSFAASIALALAIVSACSGKSSGPPPSRGTTGSAEAPTAGGSGAPNALPHIPGLDPRVHGDDRQPPPSGPPRPAHPIDVTLRSSPTGAQASVDGVPVGITPAYWAGMADGREHEFTFTLAGHAIARYRFVPVTSGVVHARLEPIADDADAGVEAPPEVEPQAQPGAVVPVPGPIASPPAASDGPSTAPIHGPQP